MRFAIHVPNVGEYGDPELLVSLAVTAEQAGWDGYFLWDHVLFDLASQPPVVDPWVVLGAAAQATSRVKLGAMVTPVPRRRPWKLAREVATLDVLSGGRAVFGAGLGVPRDAEFEVFGEDGDAHRRAARLDEGLAVVDGLLHDQAFSFHGEHYRVDGVSFRPAPRARVPIWIAGRWPNPKPFARAARWDGVVAEKVGGRMVSADDVRALTAFVAERRAGRAAGQPFDVVIGGYTDSGGARSAKVREYFDAGATWWMERVHPSRGGVAENVARVEAGPPRAA